MNLQKKANFFELRIAFARFSAEPDDPADSFGFQDRV